MTSISSTRKRILHVWRQFSTQLTLNQTKETFFLSPYRPPRPERVIKIKTEHQSPRDLEDFDPFTGAVYDVKFRNVSAMLNFNELQGEEHIEGEEQ